MNVPMSEKQKPNKTVSNASIMKTIAMALADQALSGDIRSQEDRSNYPDRIFKNGKVYFSRRAISQLRGGK